MSSCLITEIAGLQLPNPIMLASGILGLSTQTLLRAAENGAGAVVTKSVGLKPRRGYPNPTVVEVKCGLLNALGLPNPGIEYFAKEIREMKKSLRVPLIVSIYGFSPEEYAQAASIAADAGADALELNVSCPHVEKTGSEIGQYPQLAAEVVRKVKRVVEKPVFVKLTPNVSDIAEIAHAVVEASVDAITAINTIRAMAIDIETAMPILANKIGGLSGAAIKPVAVRCIYEIRRKVDVPIIGCGGITTWRDAVEFMLAGASAVQIGTVIALKNLNVFKSIAKGIEEYVKQKNFRSVKDIVGLSHKH